MNLVQLFNSMSVQSSDGESCRAAAAGNGGQFDLFGETGTAKKCYSTMQAADIAIISMLYPNAALYSGAGADLSILPPNARCLYELSVNAFDAVVHGWMSELSITTEIVRFGRKILLAAGSAQNQMMQRQAAEQAATDRGDPDVQAVQATGRKVWHEIHRLMGLLRFSPDESGLYVAECEPDHFVLPALGPHFCDRFGGTPWAIIDNKRRLCLLCREGKSPEFLGLDSEAASLAANSNAACGEWEGLWRLYHRTINNESRNNPGLQKNFMPKRYWKYLTEMNTDSTQ